MSCRVAIVSVVRNEARYLLEWMAFHLGQGVSAFRIYDNASDDMTPRLLAGLAKSVPLEIHPWREPYTDDGARDRYRQTAASYIDRADFLAAVDADEFLFSSDPGGLPIALAAFGTEVGAIGVNQNVFGSGGAMEFVPDLVTSRFTRRAPLAHPENRWIKTLVRPTQLAHFDSTHSVKVVAGIVAAADGVPLIQPDDHPGVSDRVTLGRLRMFHYLLKSRGEFETKKRRWAPGRSERGGDEDDGYAKKYSDGYFYNRRGYIDLEDDQTLAKWQDRIKATMQILYISLASDPKLAVILREFYQFLR